MTPGQPTGQYIDNQRVQTRNMQAINHHDTLLSANLADGFRDIHVHGSRGLNDTFGSTTLAQDLQIGTRDRRKPGGPMSTVRHGIDERQREGDDTRDNSRLHGGLKSSMKYAKPPCLQNTSAFALSMTGRNNTTGGIIGTNKSVHMHGDHDDLKLKLDKLSATFLEKNKEKDAFKDTFFDEEIFGEELRARNYFKLSLDLLKYALHSANQPKKKKDDKKAGASSFGGLKR